MTIESEAAPDHEISISYPTLKRPERFARLAGDCLLMATFTVARRCRIHPVCNVPVFGGFKSAPLST